jgi:hypothetical protein
VSLNAYPNKAGDMFTAPRTPLYMDSVRGALRGLLK